jgi:hypothetical protein
MMTKARLALALPSRSCQLVGFQRQSENEFTRRFSCWILGNRASMAAEQNEAPARGIPGLLRLATRVSGGHRQPYFRYHIESYQATKSFGGSPSHTYRHSRRGRAPVIPHREYPILPRASKILLSNTTSTPSIQKGGTPVRGCGPNLAHSSYISNSPSQSLCAMISCRYFIQSAPEVSVLLLPASFSARTIGECDRSLGSDVGLQPHRQTNYVNHVSG